MCQPEAQDIESLDVAQQEQYRSEVQELRESIYDVLQEYQKGVLVKLNWTSTQDAAFMTETLACYTSDEVFLQLKASSLPDLQFNLPVTLVLRKWHDGH